ncbi:hypothetical protein GJ496_003498 [Pomphorhynchus laevis]|nr:hypothetical protein GJ496_010530 [Pomphorhynchus laevis]KAI0981930.1 hypothetical protein GJ496_009768 [Pomphorhynchus laevis]KAI0981937.1 hypothetical protein GJ496_009775 [Pomphorhynchus laevis]KAI0982414.1 hypothetical protein GJ496_003498 [Pomphorhynchus laevis]
MDEKHKIECPISIQIVKNHYRSTFSYRDAPANTINSDARITFKNFEQVAEIIYPDEVLETVKSTTSDTSPGVDGISLRDLKRFDPRGYIMFILFNFCLSARYMPNAWRCH